MLLHVPSTEITAPQDAKRGALAPEPSEQLSFMIRTSETQNYLDARLLGPCIPLRAGLVQGGHDE